MAVTGDIVLIDFPQTNLLAGKLRPALVLGDALDQDMLFARITSQPHTSPTDVLLQDWQSSGLRLPSWLQMTKLATIESRLIHRILGHISVRDRAEGYEALVRWLQGSQ